MSPAATRLLSPSLPGVAAASLCSTCKHEVRPFFLFHVAQQRRRNSGLPSPFFQKLRRRVWGTDNPPGPENPYVQRTPDYAITEERVEDGDRDEGPHDRERLLAEERAEQASLDAIAPDASSEIPLTWDGLEVVGHLGRWWELPSTKADKFVP